MTVGQAVEKFIRENFFYEGELTSTTSFIDNGVIDSTGVLELVAFLEERFNIQIGNDEITLDNLGSLRGIENYISKKSAAARV